MGDDMIGSITHFIISARLRFLAGVCLMPLCIGANAQSRPKTPGTDSSTLVSPIQIRTTTTTSNSVDVVVTIQGTQEKFSAHLNGKDVSNLFSSSSCKESICKAATLTQADGLVSQKNVIAVDAGRGVTGRLRFDTSSSTSPASGSALRQVQALTTQPMSAPKAMGLGADYQSALPPTVSFTTNTPGGWNGSTPWVTINGTGYPDVAPGGVTCQGSTFLAIVLDRQTLVEKTAAPESSPLCIENTSSLTQYLSTLSANDLVIVGTNFESPPQTGIDFTAIGGTPFPGNQGDSTYPAGIMAIGVPGATKNTAYMNYYFPGQGYENIPSFAKGTLQEDAYGNYNFYSSDIVEYTVSPNDPGVVNSSATGQSAVSISIPHPPQGGVQQYVYTSPQGATNGFWVLTLSRNNFVPSGGMPGGNLSSDGTTEYIPGVGSFFNTGSTDPATSKLALQGLANAISSNTVNAFQLVFLVSVGTPIYGGPNNSIWYVGGVNASSTLPSAIASNGFYEFSQALQGIGGTPNIVQSLFTPGSTYTFVGTPGLGGPLTGAAVESSSAFAAQGQTGFVHGIMQRNSNGLYQPHQANQEPVSVFGVKGGFNSPEFKLTETVLQQPVDWPSSSTSTLLSQYGCPNCFGANTIAGQLAAYKYMSYYLISFYYMQGIAVNSHLDDIHYFFTGSYNTSINYHIFDPSDLLNPTSPNYTGHYLCDSVQAVTDIYGNAVKQCTINSFSADGEQLVFTDTDFVAVQTQLHYEIMFLTNTLQFLTTGSNNLKSVISSGSSNVGLALTGAAANVLGSDLVAPPPQTIVTTSWQSIVQLIAGSSSILTFIPGVEPLAPALNIVAKLAGGANSLIGGAMTISADAGGITKTSTSKSLPSAFATFSDDISDLANGSLQDQLAGGFDTMSDAITSDWGRLSTVGPMTADPTNLVFFAPTQASQQIAIRAVSLAASRNFYLSLMPAMGYHIDYYPGVQGWLKPTAPDQNIPDMGVYYSDSNHDFCSAFYLNPQQNTSDGVYSLGSPTPLSFLYYPSVAGGSNPFARDHASGSLTSVDMYVIGGKITYKATNSTAIGLPSSNLTSYLFTNAGLNLPIDQFVTPNGPMQNSFNYMSSSPAAIGASVGSICPAQDYPISLAGAVLVGSPQNSNNTKTSLSVPANAIFGNDIPVSATVMAGSSPVGTGSVYFTVDGAGSINADLNAQGIATAVLPASSLTSGSHNIVALYSRVAPYEASRDTATTNVYTTAPDISLSASATSMNVSYGSTSSPITLQLTSLAGLLGPINLACSGLPVGMTCTFNPSQVTLMANGQATASMTINGGTTSASSFGAKGLGILMLPITFVLFLRIRRGAAQIPSVFCLLALASLGTFCLSGCSGGSMSSSNSYRESGSKTVIVSASSGSLSRTIPIQVNIQ